VTAPSSSSSTSESSSGSLPEPATVLVTGAGGFVGRHVAEALRERGDVVVAVEHRWTHIDDVEAQLAGLVPAWCAHLGWYAEPADYLTSVDGNRGSLADSLDLVALLGRIGCDHLVVSGSCAEYAPSAADLTETAPVAPWSAYGAAKASLHLLLQSSLRPPRLTVSWARLFNVTGPGEDPSRLLPSVVRALLDDRPVALTSGEQVRDVLDVADVASALVALGDRRVEGAVNVCSGTGVDLRTLLGTIGARLGRQDRLRFGAVARGPHDADRTVGDNGRLRATTDWRPRSDDVDALVDRLIEHWSVRVEARYPA
jgi:nucleoside-diphosphate-sugar epimerase